MLCLENFTLVSLWFHIVFCVLLFIFNWLVYAVLLLCVPLNPIMYQFAAVLSQELNREEPAGLGGPQCERYVLDSRGALVERQAVVYRERLILGHCLILSVLVVRTGKSASHSHRHIG